MSLKPFRAIQPAHRPPPEQDRKETRYRVPFGRLSRVQAYIIWEDPIIREYSRDTVAVKRNKDDNEDIIRKLAASPMYRPRQC